MSKKKILVVAMAVALGAGLWTWGGPRPAGHPAKGGPAAGAIGGGAAPVPVVVAEARFAPVPVEARVVGTVQAAATVAVRSRIEAEIVGIHFKEGDSVKAGALLFTLDSREPEVKVAQAEAQLVRDQAALANARREWDRLKPLATRDVVSRQKLDEARTSNEMAEALVKGDQAALASARLVLGYTRITAPTDGRAGEVALTPGNLAKANDQTLVTLHQIQPIHVAFALPQKFLPLVRAARAGERPLLAKAAIPGDEGAAPEGEVVFVDNAVSSDTGTILLKAAFANTDERLWPGELVDVVLTLRTDPEALVIPEAAVQTGQAGTFVFVVRDGTTVEMRPVMVDRNWERLAVVTSGLKTGEPVVINGQSRLAPGSRIAVKLAGGNGP